MTPATGDLDAVLGLASAAGVSIDLATVEGLFAALDVSEQPPFTAMERLGLQIVEE